MLDRFLCIKMFLAWLLLGLLTVANTTIISDILKFKNIDHCVSFNQDKMAAIRTYKILHRSQIRFSSSHLENSSITIPHFIHKIGIVINTNDDWESAFDSLAELKKAFKYPFIWISITNDLENTIKVFSRFQIDVDSDITIIYRNDGVVNLYEIYNTGFAIEGEVVVREIGYWDRTLHIHKKNRFDLCGLTLRCIVLITKNQKVGHQKFEEYLEQTKPSLTFVDTTHKLKYYEVLKYYQDIFNITYTFSRTNSWGYPTNTGFDGLVGALYRFEADIGGSPVFLRNDRWPAVDYVAQCWLTRPKFVFRHPKHSSGVYTIFTRPLSNQVWYCIIAFLVLFTVILRQMLRLKRIRVAGDETEDSVSFAFMFTWGALCQQGSMINRNSTAIKVVILFTFVFTLTLYQYYNALVVSTLLQEQSKNIRHMRDLLDSDLKMGIEDVLYTKDFFKRTTDPLALEMYHKKIVTDKEYNYYPAEYGMSLVKRGGYAFHVETTVAYRIMQNTFSNEELCEASEVQMYLPRLTAVVLPKGSPYREQIAYAIRLMTERGLLNRLEKLWDASRPVCVRDPGSNPFSVSLYEFQTALIALAIGYIVSLILLGLEILEHAVKKSDLCYKCWKRVYEFRN